MLADEMTRRRLFGLPAFALAQRSGYVAWSWERWRQITGEQAPQIATGQAGLAALSDLLSGEVKTADAWATRRTELRRTIDAFLGTPPLEPPPLEARIDTETKLEGGILRTRVRFQSEPGEWIPAFLLRPENIRDRLPAILCPHQTTQAGKEEPAGIRGNPRLAMALGLARRGYVTLTYDAACFGERHDPNSGHYGDAIPFYQRHPHWSMMGKMAWDMSRAVDFLRTRDFVNAGAIGSIGHSHGGYTTTFAMALDPRIVAGVSSCGFDTFRYDGNPYRWSHATALMPRLGFFITSPHINIRNYAGVPDSQVIQIPFDMHWMLALLAPRPLMLATSDDDRIFPNAGWSARQAEARLRPVYELLNASDRLETFYFRGGHGFPQASEDRAFAFIDRWLRR
jgi:dienelactone hydrolase